MADYTDLRDDELTLVERIGREGGLDVQIVGLTIRHRTLLNYVIRAGHQDPRDHASLNKAARPWFKRRFGFEARRSGR